MREETVARSYAETLFTLAGRHEGPEAFQEALTVLTEALATSRLRTFLATPRITAGSKKGVLRSVLEGRVPTHFLNFVLVTVDKRRQGLLEEIARHYNALLDEHYRRIPVEVTVARPLDSGGERRITAQLSRLLGGTAIPRFRVRPEIVGGVVVRAGDRVYDGSLRRRLESMRRSLLAVSLAGKDAQPKAS